MSRRRPVGGERVRLPARPVEREHELAARPLAERLRLHERLELGDELGVAAEREIGVDSLLEHDGAQLLESRDLGLRERLVREVGQRRATPELERLAKGTGRRTGIARAERRPPLVREPREAVDVHALRLELEDVARRPRHELLGAQSLAELGDVHLDGVRRGLRRLPRPQCLDEPVDGHDATWLQREHREQRARLRAAEPDRRAFARSSGPSKRSSSSSSPPWRTLATSTPRLGSRRSLDVRAARLQPPEARSALNDP